MCWNFAYADGEEEKAIRDETGIFPVQCQICKKELLDGELLAHWRSEECVKITAKKVREEIIKSIEKYTKGGSNNVTNRR